MAKEKIILIGGGGHCKACIDVVQAQGKYAIAGIIDREERIGQDVLDYKIIGADDALEKLVRQYKNFLVCIGNIKDPSLRIKSFDALKKWGATFPVIVSPLAHVAKGVLIGEGTIVMHRAVINAAAMIGKNCIINTAALVEHDVQVKDHCHVSTGSIINGMSKIGNKVFLGSNSTVINNVEVADNVVLGAGSVIIKSIDKAGVYAGNPARKIANSVVVKSNKKD